MALSCVLMHSITGRVQFFSVAFRSELFVLYRLQDDGAQVLKSATFSVVPSHEFFSPLSVTPSASFRIQFRFVVVVYFACSIV